MDLSKNKKNMDGRKMAIVPFKLWEGMKRWKKEQIQKPRLPPDPNDLPQHVVKETYLLSWSMKICLKPKHLNYMAKPYTNLTQRIKKL